MRPFVAPKTAPADRNPFAEDVEYYLSLTPRQLPSRYLYDDLGSALFEAICQLPWYAITRIEQQLLARHAATLLARLHPLSTLVELGPGGGQKMNTLLTGSQHAATSNQQPITVHLVDLSPAALDAAVHTLAHHPDLVVVTHEASYEAGLAAATEGERSAGRTLVLFLGSNIGNFDRPGADAFLRNIRTALAAGDALLLGADLVKSERDLLLAYDDPLGVTAAFNRNLLVRVNRELGADFDIDGFAHRAVWNADASRVEMHLVSTRRQHVRIPVANLDLTFERDETIWTESSYKYRCPEIREMLERAGFRTIEQRVDETASFALTLVEAQ